MDSPDTSTRGEQALLAGDLEAAVRLLGEAVAGPTPGASDFSNLGAALHLLGRFEEALEVYRRGREQDGDRTAMLAYNAGTLLASLGRTEEAERAYRRALELDPGLEVCHDNLAALLLAGGDRAGARAAYERGLAAVPASAALAMGLGTVFQLEGDAGAAVTAFRRAAGAAAAPAEAQRRLGRALVDTGDLDEAELCYRAALTETPTDAWTLNGLGALLEMRGRLDEAAEVLDRAVGAAPDWGTAHYNFGVVRDRQQRYEDAIASYRRAVELERDNYVALKNLAGALRHLDRNEDAAAAYRRALELAPDDPVAAHLLAAAEGRTTAGAPPGYVRVLFDDYAARYTQHMCEQLEYRAPQRFRAALDALEPDRRFAHAVDLGCGTGLVGAAIRDRVDISRGVDLSPRMLEEARTAAVYDELILDDVTSALAGYSAEVELCTAAEVLIYLGDLEPLMRAAAAALVPNGLFLFSVECLAEDDERAFTLRDSGRYAHGAGYLRGLAEAHGFSIAAWEQLDLRRERHGPVAGWVIGFRR